MPRRYAKSRNIVKNSKSEIYKCADERRERKEAKRREYERMSYMTMLDGVKAAYTPGEPVNLREWFAREEKNAAASVDTHAVEKANRDSLFKYHIAKVEEDEFEDEATLTHEDFVIGVRPECVSICENGALEGEIFSAMPTGMETTVKVRVGEFLFTGVVFGGITYKIGQKVRVSFTGENVLLFSRENGKLITRGTLKI